LGDFETRIEQNRKILHKICHAYCRDPNSRDDLAQEILIQLWRAYKSFDGRCQFSTWMYRVALNVAISFHRRESSRNRNVVSGDEHLANLAAPSEPEEIRILYAFIDQLDPLNKALVVLYLDGHTHAEISAILGISETNAATKINRLKKELWNSTR
jgi:RNA polymerase sigma-70 factor (ECF subfamily)